MNTDLTAHIDRLIAKVDDLCSSTAARHVVRSCIALESEARDALAALEIDEAAIRGTFIADLIGTDPKGLGAAEWKANSAYRASEGYRARKTTIRRYEYLLRTVADLRAANLALIEAGA